MIRAALLFLGVLSCSAAIPAAAQPVGYKTSMAFIAQVSGKGEGQSIQGPSKATIYDAGKEESVPMSRVGTILAGCRMAGGMYGGSAHKQDKAVGTRYFECLQPGALSKTLQIEVVLSPDERSVEAFDIYPGASIYWLPPAPGGPAWKTWDATLFEQYKAKALAFVGAFASHGALPQGAKLPPTFLYSDDSNGTEISAADLGRILRGCQALFTMASLVPVNDNSELKEGVKTSVKCDARSSAPNDLELYFTFSNGTIDTVLVATNHEYQIPPFATAARN